MSESVCQPFIISAVGIYCRYTAYIAHDHAIKCMFASKAGVAGEDSVTAAFRSQSVPGFTGNPS